MKHTKWIVSIMIILGAVLLSACGKSAQAETKIEPAHLEPVQGKDYNQITLTEKAAERLDVRTVPMREEQVNGKNCLVLPYSTLIYDLNGDTWVYVSPEQLTFHRAPVTVDYIEGDLVILVDGPPVGTEVATMGVAELYGIDTGVGK